MAMLDKIVAEFQAQRDEGRGIYNVGEPKQVDVTERVLMMDAVDIHKLKDDDYPSDNLCPEERNAHGGPFYVSCEDALTRFFGVDELAEITQEMVVAARARLGIGEEREYQVEVSRTTTRTATITVRATTRDGASQAGLAAAGDVDFHQYAESEPELEVGNIQVSDGHRSRTRPR